ncbi:MAG: hypothetical protein HPY83_13040 [Anaerolineae bacterium]|nr:hypothetical protein [Anaerolineae bacterium]
MSVTQPEARDRHSPLRASDAFAALPPPWTDGDLRLDIRRCLEASGTAVVVVDDDPTGTQTVHDVPVLTTWGPAELGRELAAGTSVFYVLTNSRALPVQRAVALGRELGTNLRAASQQTGRRLEVISRSDSTLRGHYPAETDALAEGLQFEPDGLLIAPYFREGGRFTLDDVHYVLQRDTLVPAAQTDFARDPAFGYAHSNLRHWVEEKTGGRWPADQVASISLDAIRRRGPEGVLPQLLALKGGQPSIVNAADDRDLEVVVLALAEAENRGRRYLCRTAASFAKVRGGITDRPLLQPAEVRSRSTDARGGLVVVGSYVSQTTRQLERLLIEPGWVSVQLDVPTVLDPAQRRACLEKAAASLANALSNDANVVLFTSREHVGGGNRTEALAVGRSISTALVELVRGLPVRPRFLIAKGGITASDLATDALAVRRALVLGQIAHGVPVWSLGQESKFPGLAYVVFPGNVGTDDTLAEVARSLSQGQ